jgi:hypothetical protein
VVLQHLVVDVDLSRHSYLSIPRKVARPRLNLDHEPPTFPAVDPGAVPFGKGAGGRPAAA